MKKKKEKNRTEQSRKKYIYDTDTVIGISLLFAECCWYHYSAVDPSSQEYNAATSYNMLLSVCVNTLCI